MPKAGIIALIVGCLSLAVVIAYFNFRDDQLSIDDLEDGVMLWMKCKSCGHEFQTDRKKLYKADREDPFSEPSLGCPECSKKTAYQARQCPECQNVFFPGAAGPDDFIDRCPECKYSPQEQRVKAAR